MANGAGVLVVAELTDGALGSNNAELLGVARSLGDQLGVKVAALLLGSDVESLAQQLGALGADTVFLADDGKLGTYEGGRFQAVAQQAVGQSEPAVVLLGQTLAGRDLAARLAFALETGLVTDCTGVRLEGERLVATKPVYGGNALAEYVIADSRPQVVTLRPRAFEAAQPSEGRQVEVVRLEIADLESAVEVLDISKEVATSGPRLKDAKVVVTGGRGLGSPDNWHFVEELAEPLGAAVGATRAVTDAGWVPAGLQVGLTGATVTPDLYVAVGVSGAVQHIAGCSGARNIVAINRDADANIFKHARYGVVGDWKQILPAFTEKVKELRGR